VTADVEKLYKTWITIAIPHCICHRSGGRRTETEG